MPSSRWQRAATPAQGLSQVSLSEGKKRYGAERKFLVKNPCATGVGNPAAPGCAIVNIRVTPPSLTRHREVPLLKTFRVRRTTTAPGPSFGIHMMMTHTYGTVFVALSVVVAMLASFAALDLAGRVRSEAGSTRHGWIVGGAVVMGLGIWSMHFIGMLAFHLPVPISYDVPLILLSVVVAIAASLLALVVVSRARLRVTALVPAGIMMGGAIAGMHYIGMASVRADARLTYSPSMVALSVLIAIVASLVALWLAFTFRSQASVRGLLLKSLSAVVMGVAISGMHYTAMAAARFAPGHSFPHSPDHILASGELGGAVVVSAILIIVLALIGAVIDRNIQGRAAFTRQLAAQTMQLGKSEEQYRLLFDHNPNPMWVYDPSSLAFLAVNETAVGRYGYTREEFLSMTLRDISCERNVSTNDGPAISSVGRTASTSAQVRHIRKDSSVVDVELTSRSIIFDGRAACLALALDVTDRRRSEEALRQSEQRTRLIVDTALDAVITMDADGRISAWNAQAERMFGWSREEVAGRRMADTIIPSIHRAAHQRGLQRFLETGEGPILSRRIEMPALRRDGTEFPVELAISPAKLGSDWTFSAFIRDLTEQKKAAEAVRIGEQRYRELFEDIPVGVYRSTPDGKLIDANLAMVSMLAYPDRQSLLATPATALYVDSSDRLRWRAEMTLNGGVRDFDVRMRRADGAVIWARDTTHAKREPGGEVVLYEGILEDITARVEAEGRLQASERRLIQILEAVPLGISVSDDAGRPVFANAAAQKILGNRVLPSNDFPDLAATFGAYLAGTEQPYPLERMPLVRALRGEAAAVDDMEIRRDGRVISLNVQGAPIMDNEGRIVAAVAVFMDTTDRRSLEAQLRQASKMEAVGQLAGGVAHDFNNLLTVIMSYGGMLLDRIDAGDPNREDVQEIAAAADRASGLTRQLLAFSRKQVMQPRVISLNATVTDLENMLRRLIGEDIELQTSLASDLGRINADPGQVEQVLMNLVVNARDAMPNGGRLTIHTSNSELSGQSAAGALRAADGRYVMLAVSDTGMGMTREVQQRLFDPFFTTKEQGRGTGLGLSTVYGIVKQSGGEICVYSEPGMGTTFKVYFPPALDAEEQRPGIRLKQIPHGSETLLLVEDDANLRTLALRVLKNVGYEVLVAGGGLEAISIASDPRLRIDAVITDVVMPDMNGRVLIERLLQSRPDVSFLFMSGYTDDDVLRRGVLHGEAAFLQKPFTANQLARKVREVLDQQSA